MSAAELAVLNQRSNELYAKYQRLTRERELLRDRPDELKAKQKEISDTEAAFVAADAAENAMKTRLAAAAKKAKAVAPVVGAAPVGNDPIVAAEMARLRAEVAAAEQNLATEQELAVAAEQTFDKYRKRVEAKVVALEQALEQSTQNLNTAERLRQAAATKFDDASLRITRLEGDLRTSQQQLLDAGKGNVSEQLLQELGELQATKDANRETITAQERQIEALSTDVDALRQTAEQFLKLRREHADLQTAKQAVDEQIATLTTERDAHKNALDETRAQLVALQQESAKLQAAWNAEKARLSAIVEAAKDKETAWNDEKERLDAALKRSNDGRAALAADLDDANKQIQSMRDLLAKESPQLADLTAQLELAKQQNSVLRDVGQQQATEFAAEKQRLVADLKDARDANADLQAALTSDDNNRNEILAAQNKKRDEEKAERERAAKLAADAQKSKQAEDAAAALATANKAKADAAAKLAADAQKNEEAAAALAAGNAAKLAAEEAARQQQQQVVPPAGDRKTIELVVPSGARLYRLITNALSANSVTKRVSEPVKNDDDTKKLLQTLVNNVNKLVPVDKSKANVQEFQLSGGAGQAFVVKFAANAANMRYFVQGLTKDILVLWGQHTLPNRLYWTRTIVPLLIALAVDVKNKSVDEETEAVLGAEILRVIAIGMAGHTNSVEGGALKGKYIDTVYGKMSKNYGKDAIIAAIRKNTPNTNQYGQALTTAFQSTLKKTPDFAGMPVPLLAMAAEVAKAHSGVWETSSSTDISLLNGQLSYSMPAGDENLLVSNDELVSIFGLPIFQALFSERVNGQLVLHSPKYSNITTGNYVDLTRGIIRNFVQANAELFATRAGRFVVVPLYSEGVRTPRPDSDELQTTYNALPKFGGASVAPTMQQVDLVKENETAAILNLENPSAAVDPKRAFVDFLYELASLTEIWTSNAPSTINDSGVVYDASVASVWLEQRMAWAYKIAGAVLFTPVGFKDAPRSFFQRLAVAPSNAVTVQSTVRVFGVNDYDDDGDAPTTVDSSVSLVPRFARGTLSKQLDKDRKNGADITLYRNALKNNSQLAELFDEKDLHTVLVPNNTAIGYYESDKVIEFPSLPLSQRPATAAIYAQQALVSALQYYMFEGDVSFDKKRGETVALASKKTNRNGVSLRLYVAVDPAFDSDKGGYVTLSGALDGTRPLRARLSGKVLATNGRYYVIDHILDPAAAERRGAAADYAPEAPYAPREPIVSTYQSSPSDNPSESQYENLRLFRAAAEAREQQQQATSGCRAEVLERLSESDDQNESEFNAFFELMPKQAKKALNAATKASRPLHIYVPAPAALEQAAIGLDDERLTALLLAHIGISEYRIISPTDQPSEPVRTPFTAALVQTLAARSETTVVSTLQPQHSLLYGRNAAARLMGTWVALRADDFDVRPTTFVYKPKAASMTQVEFYRANPIHVHYVKRVLGPTTAAASSEARTIVPTSAHAAPETRIAAVGKWQSLLAATAHLLRTEPLGERLLAHVRQLDAELTALGGTALIGAEFSRADLERQRATLTTAISQNDTASAADTSDARAAVLDLYDRF